MKTRSILLLSTLFFLVGCGNKKSNSYYFPINQFTTEKTYCYIDKNDTTNKEYWKMQTTIEKGDTFFRTSHYNAQNRITQTMVEKISLGNSNMVSYVLYQDDSEGKHFEVTCKIIDSQVYKSSQKVGEKIQWKVSYIGSHDHNTWQLTKIRTLKSVTNHQQTFDDLMIIELAEQGHKVEIPITSVYEKNKGLVSFQLKPLVGFMRNYELVE